MAVSSRIFGIKVNNKKTDCFAPLADMLNHRRPRQTQWFFSDEIKSFVIQAIQDIEKGEQVFDSYGKKCNSRFLLNYGFIVEKNDSNEFPFIVQLSENAALYSYKVQFMQNKELKRVFRLQACFDEQIVIDFFSYLRFIFYDEDPNRLVTVILLS